MSWFWMAFFLILSAVAVAAPFALTPRVPPGETSGGDLGYRRRRIEASLRDLDLDLGAGKVSPEDHSAATAELRDQLARLGQEPPVPPPASPPPGAPPA